MAMALGDWDGRHSRGRHGQRSGDQQREFLDCMRHREPDAWHKFMNQYAGWDVWSIPMPELKDRFNGIVREMYQYRGMQGHYAYTEATTATAPVQKKTWFEEIQAEVNEWLKEIT